MSEDNYTSEIAELETRLQFCVKQEQITQNKAYKYKDKAVLHQRQAHQKGHSLWTWAWHGDAANYNQKKADEFRRQANDYRNEEEVIQSHIASLKKQQAEKRDAKIDLSKQRYVDPIQARYEEKYKKRMNPALAGKEANRLMGKKMDTPQRQQELRKNALTGNRTKREINPNANQVQQDPASVKRWEQNEKVELKNQEDRDIKKYWDKRGGQKAEDLKITSLSNWQKMKDARDAKNSNQDPELQAEKDNAFYDARENWRKDSDNYVRLKEDERSNNRGLEKTISRER